MRQRTLVADRMVDVFDIAELVSLFSYFYRDLPGSACADVDLAGRLDPRVRPRPGSTFGTSFDSSRLREVPRSVPQVYP